MPSATQNLKNSAISSCPTPPPIFSLGMRIGMGYSWRAIIAAEMIAASSGIGHLILFAQQLSRTDKVIVGIFVVGLVGLATDKCFGFLLKKLFKGNGENGWN